MAKASRGTVFNIDSKFLDADRALRIVQNFFVTNPEMSPNAAIAAGHGAMLKDHDRAWRIATGSKTTLVHCPCRIVNPHITDGLVTECCGSSTVVVCG